MNDELMARILTRASNPATIHDNTKYWQTVAKINPKATLEQIAATETAIGFELPQLLKQIHLEIGSGGFGPGYGLIGVHRGYADMKGEHLTELAQQLGALNRQILPICNWGCGIYSCLDCAKPEAPVFVFDPELHALSPENLISVSVASASGEVQKIYERESRAPRPAIITPKTLALIAHKSSFQEFILDWADGLSLWDQIQGLPQTK